MDTDANKLIDLQIAWIENEIKEQSKVGTLEERILYEERMRQTIEVLKERRKS